MSEYSAERVLPATPRRRQLAREEGRVAKSHDLPAAVVLLAGLAFLLFFGTALVQVFDDFARQQFGAEAWLKADSEFIVQSWRSILLAFGRVLAPVLAVLLVAALAGNLGQSGLMFVPGRLVPDASRINPVTGLLRLCSIANGSRVVLAVVKIAVILGVVGWIVWTDRARFLALGVLPADGLIHGLADLALGTCLKIAGALLALGLADYAYQRWRFENSLKMTPDEMREEMRHQQGDPTLARRRHGQRELALAGLQRAAAKADLVIAHGTRTAVALCYDPRTMPAPTIVAKGSGDAAQRICLAAQEGGVPVRDDRRLASSLCRTVGLGRTIRPDQYADVAAMWPERD